MSKSDTAIRMASVAAKVGNIGQARAALGKTSEILREGYERLDDVPNLGGSFLNSFKADWLRTGGLRDELRQSLDTVNARAQELYKIYAGADADLFMEEISTQNAAKIGDVLERARKTLRDVEEARGSEFWEFCEILLTVIVAAAGEAVDFTLAAAGRVAGAVGGVAFAALWPIIAALALALAVYFIGRSWLSKKVTT